MRIDGPRIPLAEPVFFSLMDCGSEDQEIVGLLRSSLKNIFCLNFRPQSFVPGFLAAIPSHSATGSSDHISRNCDFGEGQSLVVFSFSLWATVDQFSFNLGCAGGSTYGPRSRTPKANKCPTATQNFLSTLAPRRYCIFKRGPSGRSPVPHPTRIRHGSAAAFCRNFFPLFF